MADLPKSIRVGYRDFAIEKWQKPDMDNVGICDTNWAIIRVDDNYGPQRAAEVLLHEILHAVYRNGVLAPGDDEEKVVTVLANQLTQVWRDNPEFVAFMSASLTPAT